MDTHRTSKGLPKAMDYGFALPSIKAFCLNSRGEGIVD
jgi:hypothetical protein